MKLDPKQYDEMVNRASPPSPVVRDCVWAFCVGGAICTLGEGLLLVDMYRQGVRDLNELPEASPGLGSIWRRARSWLRRLR